MLLVKIAAASINPIDFKVQNGDLKLLTDYPMPLILGSDFSGTVTKVGSSVTDYQVGDEIYGRPNVGQLGAFAEYIAVDQKNVAKKPTNLDLIESASIPS